MLGWVGLIYYSAAVLTQVNENTSELPQTWLCEEQVEDSRAHGVPEHKSSSVGHSYF